MADPFIAEIRMWGCNFAPRGWAFCNGQLLSIASNTALFSILGTTYGGDGRTTFGLPNLQGRAALHTGSGTGPGLSSYSLGQSGGAEDVTLSINQMPSHNHLAVGNDAEGTAASPVANVWATPGANRDLVWYEAGNGSTVNMSPTALTNTGGSQSHETLMPYLAVYFCIALVGVFPSRN